MKIDDKELFGGLQETVSLVVSAVREKGPKHFARHLAAAGIFILGAYAVVYAPSGKRLKRLNMRLEAAEATSQYADSYATSRDQLNRLYNQLPPMKARDQWLLDTLIDSMKAEGIISDSIIPPTEEEGGGLIFQRADMNSTLTFAEFFAWLNRIENSKPVIHVDSIRVAKKGESLGKNGVQCRISTVIPKGRLTQ